MNYKRWDKLISSAPLPSLSHRSNEMAKQLLVRNVPDEICSWIEDLRQQNRMTQQEIVLSLLKKARETEDASRLPLLAKLSDLPPVQSSGHGIPFTFIDLFAGIGGFRVALENLGGRCLYSCEWDRYSQKTYNAWFREKPHDDIRKVAITDIPDHDIMAAGFPCQPFSIAGVSKRKSLGYAHGFACRDQGNLFFRLATIIEAKRPPILFLENVKNLQSHEKGETWRIIQQTLEDLNYHVFAKVIDAAGWVPQHRERVYIVCFDKQIFRKRPDFVYPEPPDGRQPRLSDILEKSPDAKYTLSDHLWQYLQNYAEKHRLKGNGFGYGLVDKDGISRTLSARYFKDGSEILVPQEGKNPRRLTPSECSKLMGFDPDRYSPVVSDTQAYRQFGNAVVPKVVEAVARQIMKILAAHIVRKKNGCLLKGSSKVPAA